VEWREAIARDKRASFRNDEYWGRGVPGFGDPSARILVLGLAPAAHGANRTGRMFTGDRSGDWLYRAMHKAGLANQAESTSKSDGLVLNSAWVTSVVKCAPPDNKPTIDERKNCHRHLEVELQLLTEVSVVVCLGAFAYEKACREFAVAKKPKFGHGVEASGSTPSGRKISLICSFHPSQQNTFTGKLTEPMIDAVFTRAVKLSR
jgi:uracil-DNA glycosylase family 4